MNTLPPPPGRRQRGVASVEFALVAMMFFTILLFVLELARLLYVFNSLQEVTRRAAREASVRWVGDEQIVTLALFGGDALPAGADVNRDSITITYLQVDGTEVGLEEMPDDAADNLSACGDADRTANCIYSVRASVTGVSYTPMLSLFDFLDLQLPPSQVTMHAESMGFEI